MQLKRQRCLQELLDLDDLLDGGAVQGQRKKAARVVCSDDNTSDGPPAAPQHATAGVLLPWSARMLLYHSDSSCLPGEHLLGLACYFPCFL